MSPRSSVETMAVSRQTVYSRLRAGQLYAISVIRVPRKVIPFERGRLPHSKGIT